MLFLLGALSSSPLLAQQNNLDSLLNTVVQPSADSYDFELVLKNISTKNIVAYNVEITTYSSRGPQVSNMNMDLLPSYAGVTRSPLINSRFQHFGPLASGEQMFQLLPGSYAPDARITTKVTTIIFDDNTTAGDLAWAEFVFNMHASASAELAGILGIIQSSNLTGTREQIKAWRQELSQRWKDTPISTHLRPGISSGVGYARTFVINKLAEVSRQNLSDADVINRFQDAVAYLSDTANDMRNHSRMVGANQ